MNIIKNYLSGFFPKNIIHFLNFLIKKNLTMSLAHQVIFQIFLPFSIFGAILFFYFSKAKN